MSGWIGVDFDGTLAIYGSWVSASHVGEPIPAMVERVKRWRQAGHEVRIFTARIHPLDCCVTKDVPLPARSASGPADRMDVALDSLRAIQRWSLEHLGEVLPVTNVKDYGMHELWDDRAVQVRPNTGEPVGQSTRGLE